MQALGTSAPDADLLVVNGTSLDCADLAAAAELRCDIDMLLYLSQSNTSAAAVAAAGIASTQALGISASDADSLVVTGTSLDCADLAASLAVQPVGLAAVEARLAVADPALYREYQVGNMPVVHHYDVCCV
jgi:hypothetical protein